MRILALLTTFYFLGVYSLAQDIYTDLDHVNYRNHEAFHKTIGADDFDASTLNACIFFATNEIRVKNKLTPLSYHPALEYSSTLQSKAMANQDFFGHTNPNKRSLKEPEDRAKAAGIANPHIAENIIEGFILMYTSGMEVIPEEPGVFVDPRSNKTITRHSYLSLTDNLLKMWMNSKGHKENILSTKAIQLGCGTAPYLMHEFNDMPAVKATQSFQWFEEVNLLK